MYTPLICDGCGVEIFIDVNMVMLKDELWKSLVKDPDSALCDKCIEKEMGRPIERKDFKESTMGLPMIPANAWWIEEQERQGREVK